MGGQTVLHVLLLTVGCLSHSIDKRQIFFQDVVRQRSLGNNGITQCPCVLHPESRQCVAYDSRYQASTVEEAILTFTDLTSYGFIPNPVTSATFSCQTAECQHCFGLLYYRLIDVGFITSGFRPHTTLLPRSQLNPNLCLRYNFPLPQAVPPPPHPPEYIRHLISAGMRFRQSGGLRAFPRQFFNRNRFRPGPPSQNNNGSSQQRNQQQRIQQPQNRRQQLQQSQQPNQQSRQQPNQQQLQQQSRQQPWQQRQPQQWQQQRGSNAQKLAWNGRQWVQQTQQAQQWAQPRMTQWPQQTQQWVQQPQFQTQAQTQWNQPQVPATQQLQQPQWQQQAQWVAQQPQWAAPQQQWNEPQFQQQIPPAAQETLLHGALQQTQQIINTQQVTNPFQGSQGSQGQGQGQGNFGAQAPFVGSLLGGFHGRKKREVDPLIGQKFVIACVRRGETTTDDGEFLSLCGACWTWRQLPEDYFPRILNELSCQENDFCLSGWGQCAQQFRNVDVLRRMDGRWVPTVITTSTCCDCKVKAGTEIHALVVGDRRKAE